MTIYLEKNKKELTTLEDFDESVISDLEKLKQENRENNQKIGKLQEQIKYEEKILEELKRLRNLKEVSLNIRMLNVH